MCVYICILVTRSCYFYYISPLPLPPPQHAHPPPRLRDLSAEDKVEHQRVKKDFEKNSSELNLIKEQKEKLVQELQVGGVK
jgi:hypothetical protein